MRLVKVAVACVNQTPLAWDDNLAHLRAAIDQARAKGVTVLCLPELAITGYGCEDTFFMHGLQDTAFAQLDALAELTAGMVVAVGLPASPSRCAASISSAIRRRATSRSASSPSASASSSRARAPSAWRTSMPT